jgi:DtxR family Mn-dependent transcriptional regulator
MELSIHVEDYLKSIYHLQSQYVHVPNKALAEHLGVSSPAVTGMARKLTRLGLLVRERYKGVRLTARGETMALQVIRAHRLWELYLVRELDLSWDQAHVEAERLEHALSETLADRLDEALNHPTVDPHGQPIPTRDGRLPIVDGKPLAELTTGETGTTLQIRDETPELLRYLAKLGIYPGQLLTVLQVDPFDGPIHLQVGEDAQVLGREAATHVLVQMDGGGTGTSQDTV